jgi:hypothetical protein
MACRKWCREMSNKRDPKTSPDQPIVYKIKIKGHLGPQWAGWFENATIALQEDGDTLLTLPVVDQAALHGLLKKIRDLGMPLVSVNRIVSNQNSSKKEK